MQIPVVENVLKLNDEVAALNRQTLRALGLTTIDLIGAPGCGKTALLEATLRRLQGRLRLGVMAGDLTTTRDAQRLARFCPQVVQINTGRGCHLDANQVRQAMSRLDLAHLDLLVIENVGNLICPVGFDLGQDLKVGMFSVTEGDDKPAKHPYIVAESSLLLLNKTDLLPYVSFSMDVFRRDVERLNPRVPLLTICATGDQIDPWINWLLHAVAKPKSSAPGSETTAPKTSQTVPDSH
jgi:hydrogenase nickel incorporation protein HypB